MIRLLSSMTWVLGFCWPLSAAQATQSKAPAAKQARRDEQGLPAPLLPTPGSCLGSGLASPGAAGALGGHLDLEHCCQLGSTCSRQKPPCFLISFPLPTGPCVPAAFAVWSCNVCPRSCLYLRSLVDECRQLSGRRAPFKTHVTCPRALTAEHCSKLLFGRMKPFSSLNYRAGVTRCGKIMTWVCRDLIDDHLNLAG